MFASFLGFISIKFGKSLSIFLSTGFRGHSFWIVWANKSISLVYLILLSLKMSLCLHLDNSSLNLLMRLLSSISRILSFSVEHRLQFLLVIDDNFTLSIIFQVIEYSVPASCSFHTYLDSEVSVLYAGSLKLDL